jgi:elongation factor G
MREAIHDQLLCGSLLGYPMVNTRVRVLDGRHSNLRSKSPLIFQQGAVSIVRELFAGSSPCLLEPFMTVELNVPERIMGDLMSDITGKRGGRVLGIRNVKARFSADSADEIDDQRKSIFALMPLSEMVGYNTYLRSISKGEAAFTMTFSHYEKISGMKQAEILENPFYS